MSDIEPADISSSSARFTEELNKDLGEVLGKQFERSKKQHGERDREREREREGLPPGFRMRADAHYVDQLTARSADMPLRSIPIDDIDAGSPVEGIDLDTIHPLVRSVATHGVVQPLLVRKQGAGYRLIAGRRRLAAARTAKLLRVPCLVHQVDDEQAESLARADNLRSTEATATAGSAVSTETPSEFLVHLSDSVATMNAAMAMLSGQGTPMAQQIALDLLQAEVRRAGWQLRAAAIFENRHAWHFRRTVLGTPVSRVCQELGAESRLTGVELTSNIPDWNVAAAIDEEAVLCGVAGAIFAAAGLAERAQGRAITVTVVASPDDRPSIDVTHGGVAVLADVSERFFDKEWTDRPGGWPAAIGAAVAKTVAERHGGQAVLLNQDGRGSTIRLTFGQ